MNQDDLLKIIQVISVELACSSSQAAQVVRNPRPGDLVFEQSSRRMDGIGRLILHRKEFVKFTEPEDEEHLGYDDEFWYIEMLDGELAKWNNCGFYRILEKTTFWLSRDGDEDRTEWVKEAIKRHNLNGSEPR